MIPGSNLLKKALTLLGKTTVSYFRYNDRSVNDVGQYVSTYDEPVDIAGSLQPVGPKMYKEYGLDLQKTYFVFFASENTTELNREVSGDQLEYEGFRYQCESATEWFSIDGWKEILCVQIGPVS